MADREKTLSVKITEARRADIHKQLGYLRCWIDGFNAAGKTGPHAADVLRQVQILLGDAK
jgi:hypothetical protein